MGTTTEQRLDLLEAEVARLRLDLERERPQAVGKTHSHFLDVCVGIFENRPLFEEMTRAIEQEREQERQVAAT
jgi:hypothetical protein